MSFLFAFCWKSAAYPRTTAVLVRNHGIYVWGDSWFCAKTQKAECYHYHFDAALKLRQFGLDHTDRLYGPVKKLSFAAPRKNYPARNAVYLCGLLSNVFLVCIVRDGRLFPYAHDNEGKHLSATYDSKETQAEIKLSCYVKQALKENVQTQLIPPSDAPKDIFGEQDTKTVNSKAKSFRTFLKHSPCAESKGEIFRTWFIIFAPCISFLFRNKREARSCTEIFLSVGADEPSQITSPRTVAAKEAGNVWEKKAKDVLLMLDTVILERPGNAPLPSGQQAPFGTLMILKVCKLLLKQRIAPWHIRVT
ncbi:hypothetical protein SELMODRAFT_405846 [Selaginella moellendorffii]|uniref:Class II aldolase/adducin N-terminal domain-containing protein n=1 Tax=Selaginella moellendorffii TaxID=88036 RepID=D8QZV9_SELML|nr:hypothetical protein SELMODRAFT_405846 [Selaginella moellendorffii]